MPAVLTAWLRSVAHPLACAFLAFCVAGLWGAVVPLGEAPDEPGHYDYIVSVMRGDLPALEMPTTPEAFQPPLAYVVAAALARPFSAPHPSALELNPTASFNPDTPRTPFFKALFHHPPEQNRPWQGWVRLWHLLRMVSAGWLALAAFATFLTARRLFPRSPALWPLVVGVTTLLPQQVFIGMTVSNDPAALALAALAVWALVVAWQDKPGTRTALLFGLLAGLLMLTKLSLAPLTLALVVMPAVWRRNWTWAAASGLVGGLLWLPWAARLWRHDGDPTGQRANLDLHPTLRPPDDLTLAFWQDMLRTTEASIWGRFGWMNVGAPVDVYRPATLLCAALLVVGLALAARRDDRALWATLAGVMLATTVALIRFMATIGYSAAQGRLLIAAAPTAALIVSLPLAKPLKRVPRWVGWLGLGLIAALDLLVLFLFVRPAYQ